MAGTQNIISDGGGVREWDHPLDGTAMNPDVEQAICAKSLSWWRYAYQYWAGPIARGERYWKDLVGDIFTPGEELEFSKQDKIMFKIPELVPKINALEGMQIGARRKGTVVAVNGEDAPDVSIIDHILREDIDRKNNLPMELTRTFTDGIVTGFPQAFWFDKADPDDQMKKLDGYHGEWNDTLPDPKFTRMDYSDGQKTPRARTMTREQLLLRYPARKDRINALLPEGTNYDSLALGSFGSADSSENRSDVIRRLNQQITAYAQTGLIYVIETLFFVTRPTEVWVAPGTTQVEILPFEWTDAEKKKWQAAHPNYTAIQKDMRILWVTTIATCGIVLENKPHWYQEGEFPCEFYIPRMWNGQIHGVSEFLSGSLKGRNVTKIEQLHSLRLSNDQLMVMRQGAVANAASAATEKARTGGIIVLKPLANMDDVKFITNTRENTGWNDMSESFLGDLDRLSVDRNFEGGMQSSQESGRDIAQRISQTQNKHLAYLTSFGLFNLRVTRKAVRMIPYLWSEPEIYRYIDPKHPEMGTQEVELNSPEEFNYWTGAVARVKNNLEGARYDYVEVEGDNSPTAKEHEMLVFQDTLDHLSQMDVKYWPTMLKAIPNQIAQEFGRLLQAQLDAEAKADPKPEPAPAKVQIQIKGEDIGVNPDVMKVLRAMKILPEPQGEEAEAAMPAMAA